MSSNHYKKERGKHYQKVVNDIDSCGFDNIIFWLCHRAKILKEIKASLPEIKAGESRIFLYRPSSFIGGGLKPRVMLNGMQIG
jgi:hypothetical protein